MSFNFEDFFDLADYIVASPRYQEAAIRRATSSIYYAAYQLVADRYHFTATRSGDIHGQLQRHVSGESKGQLSRWLKQLCDLRVVADYNSPPRGMTSGDYDNAKDLFVDIRDTFLTP